MHPSEVVAGYKKAWEKVDTLLDGKFLGTLNVLTNYNLFPCAMPGMTCFTVEDIHDEAQVKKAIKAVIASKHYGYEDMLSTMVASACCGVLPPKGKAPKINVDNIRVCKLRGGSIHDSEVRT